MSKEVRDYEMMVIFKPLLPDDVRKGSHKSIVDLAQKLGGEVKSADVWGKRYLAYPIKSHDEGYYIVYQLKLPAGSAEKFKTGINRIGEVLRYLLDLNEGGAKPKKKFKKKVIEI